MDIIITDQFRQWMSEKNRTVITIGIQKVKGG